MDAKELTDQIERVESPFPLYDMGGQKVFRLMPTHWAEKPKYVAYFVKRGHKHCFEVVSGTDAQLRADLAREGQRFAEYLNARKK